MAWLFIFVVLAAPKAAMHRLSQNQTHAAKNNKRRLKRQIKKTGHNLIFQWTVFFICRYCFVLALTTALQQNLFFSFKI
jgi:hypothetical protein